MESVPEASVFGASESEVFSGGFVPLMERDPRPEAFELKGTDAPFLVTVTAEGLPACTVMVSVTVYSFSQGPVTESATSLLPSLVTSSQV